MKSSLQSSFYPIGYGKRITLLFLIFFVMVVISSLVAQFTKQIFPDGSREYLLLTHTLQTLIMFITPAITSAYFVSKQPISLLGLNKTITWRNLVGILLLIIAIMPILNQIIWWNAHLSLPDYMSEFETWIKEMEATASNMQQVMLSSDSIGGMVVAVVVVGIMTGFGEEIFFRGAMQRIIASNGMNHHLAIWIVAVIFSLLHFQFYGFIPRILLGAFFGYLFYWSGSIWVSATAHAINNSMVVIFSYLSSNGYKINEFEHIGVIEEGFPIWIAIGSVITTTVIILFFKNYFFGHKK